MVWALPDELRCKLSETLVVSRMERMPVRSVGSFRWAAPLGTARDRH